MHYYIAPFRNNFFISETIIAIEKKAFGKKRFRIFGLSGKISLDFIDFKYIRKF